MKTKDLPYILLCSLGTASLVVTLVKPGDQPVASSLGGMCMGIGLSLFCAPRLKSALAQFVVPMLGVVVWYFALSVLVWLAR